MANRKLGFGSLFSLILILNLRNSVAAFVPADNYLIDCGSLTDTKVDDRVFEADSSRSWSLNTPKDVLTNITNPNSVSSLTSSSLYLNARVFTGPSSYSFPIKQQGRHFIRLYFFPFDNQQFKLTTSQFSVSTQDNTLLSNFQPRPDSTTAVKEFSANINHDNLILSFIPGSNSFAFVSALEVVSVPNNLILDTAQNVNNQQTYQGLSNQVLETVYRLNMGGPKLLPVNDTLWRTWNTDGVYLINANVAKNVSYAGDINYVDGATSPEIAPKIVYSTATELASQSSTLDARVNVTWMFKADSSFSYLVRMHFCDIVSKALNNLYFRAYINSWSASNNIDLSTLSANSLHTAIFMDFVVGLPAESNNLSVSIGPSDSAGIAPDGILNGLEIMKISNSGPGAVVEGSSKSKIGPILGAVFGVLALVIIAAVVFCLFRRRKKAKKQQSKTWLPFSINGGTSQSLASRTSNITTATSGKNGNLGYRFSFVVLQEATNNFDENWVIGVGGFGKVYKGVLRDETKVAVKRGNPKSQQGLNEFRTEIELLSRLRHRHLVSLIGYCDERNEMILVYEYMEKGTLKSHLYGSDLPNLNWEQRLEICIGSARGLHYLHTGSAKAIIHRDVKSANILLDENLMAKVADFGLSKTGPELDQTHVSTAVKGSFGYLDPEYFRRQQLTEKSDVYSFGVVLLEVLCARPVIDPTLPREMVNLAEWGMKWQKRGDLDQIIDARIAGTIKPDSLRKFAETVEKCLADFGVERPTMGDVLWNLEYALQLQEAQSPDSEANSINRIVELSSQVQNMNNLGTVAEGGIANSSLNDLSDVSMSRVFSQLIKSEGR
ncbi:receptor-like protein kinase HERK 1 [Dendrobium catenatum]|uniref:Receptor-like protein kinase HERK 1 n=1 Tax=Dendrobium catenatum TaxID=906689 RepID=A0A2I0WTC7_9ASPA|nr:receptor-like protein kinase HERK 1 [Dendrobium catenatum]PKU78914.1 Receptor-like protein kinase HERK 1 [Dendrobium catenatum]